MGNAGGDADADNTNGGLFDKDRIADLFDHRDNCISSITTTVTIHTGGCNHVATTGVAHCGGQASGNAITGDYLAKYTWAGTEGARGTKVAGTQVFPEYEAGTYAIVYETKDQHFTSKACRQIENVDHTHPIIQILGSDVMTLEATHQGNYIDDGATCSDQVDGVISQNVEGLATSSTSPRSARTPSPTTARIRPTTPPRPPPALWSSPRRPARSALCTATLSWSTRLRSRTRTLVRRAVTSSTARSPRTALRTTPRGMRPRAAATSSTSRSLACTTSCTLLRTPSASGTTAPTAVAVRPRTAARGPCRIPSAPSSRSATRAPRLPRARATRAATTSLTPPRTATLTRSTLLRALPATWRTPSSRTATLSRRSWPRRPPRRSK